MKTPSKRRPSLNPKDIECSSRPGINPGKSIPYLCPVRFLPSIITFLKILLIRVW